MYKIKAGIVTIEGKKYGCYFEQLSGHDNFIHLANGDSYNEEEVDELIYVTDFMKIDVELLCEDIEKQYL